MILQDYITDIAAGPFGSNLKVSCFVEKGFPIIDGANLKGYKVTDNVTKFVTEEKARSLHRSIAKRGDVVVTISGNVGQISYIPDNSQYEEYLVSQRQFRASFDRTKVNVAFLVYYFHTREGQHKILSFANQVGVPALAQPLKNFRNISIDLPSKEVQDKVADFISNIEDKITVNRRICENLEAQAQALFKHWFIDFAPFKDGKFIESELGMIPEGWRVGTLGEIADVTMGQSPSGSSYNEDGNGVIFYQGRTEFGFRFPSIRLFTTEPKRFAEPLNTLLSVRAPVGDINVAIEKCCIGRGLASIKSNKGHNSFVYYLLKSLKRRFDVYNGEGTVFGSINKDTLNGMAVLIPPTNLAKDFEVIAEKLDKRILESFNENLRLATLRDSLLPKLMSGQIKV